MALWARVGLEVHTQGKQVEGDDIRDARNNLKGHKYQTRDTRDGAVEKTKLKARSLQTRKLHTWGRTVLGCPSA